jgi:hypothetical protein
MAVSRWLAPLWAGRMLEWSLVATLTLASFGALWRDWKNVQGRVELAAIQSTVGALRTAFALDYVERAVRTPAGQPALAQVNPFLILKAVPVNYAGELRMGSIDTVPAGSWVFDAECVCVGYSVLYPQWLAPSPDGPTVWFRVSGPAGGPLQLHALNTYVWNAQALQ